MTVTRRTPVKWKHQHPDHRPLVSVTKAGQPVESIDSERIINVEEEVMTWTDAGHIHEWFERNIEGVRGSWRTPVFLPWHKLDKLLADCEKVLFASHLVPAVSFVRDFHWYSADAKEAAGNPRMVVKNVNVAHNVMPLPRDHGLPDEYDESYIKAIEDTRSWAAKMKLGPHGAEEGQLYYSCG